MTPVAQTHQRHRGTEPHTAMPTGRRAILQQAPAPLSLRLLQRHLGPSAPMPPTAITTRPPYTAPQHSLFPPSESSPMAMLHEQEKRKKAPSPHGSTCPPRPPHRLTCLQLRHRKCLRRGQPPSPHGKDTQGSPARPTLPSFSAVGGPQPIRVSNHPDSSTEKDNTPRQPHLTVPLCLP